VELLGDYKSLHMHINNSLYSLAAFEMVTLDCVQQFAIRDHREASMNWDQIEGKWKQYSGKAKSKWGKFTDDDVKVLSGKKDQLVGLVQERYGIARDEAERQVDEFGNSFSDDNATQRDENNRRDKTRSAGSV
jgi:uncharacterized protein YjbJ (UPF0337 family)